MDTPILHINSLYKSFGGLTAITAFEMKVYRGDVLGLIGPNGSGKTTLFSLITGFLTPDSGRIIYNDENITGKRPHEICRKGIARTFQIVRPLRDLTILDNVITACLYGSRNARSMREATDRAEEILNLVGLHNKKRQLAKTLSLPEIKRLELARAAAGRPQMLLLDEIMGGLNPREGEVAMKVVKRINDSGVTVILVEHNVRLILRNCNRIVVLNHGLKIADGIATEVCNSQEVIEAYLGKG